MIGVLANAAERGVVREFFELFKTPWEFYRGGREYEVLVCAEDVAVPAGVARLTVVYGARQLASDRSDVVAASPQAGGRQLSYQDLRIPVYLGTAQFPGRQSVFLRDDESRLPAAYLDRTQASVTARIGYDLFREIGALLTTGQPAARAAIPTLELHIAVLRDLITASGIGLVEIPPVPPGYRFIACLTHDVDHPSVRRHCFDHTMLGFLYRAVFESFVKAVAGRIPAREFLRNWVAAMKLPFVYLGVVKDFWRDFVRYPELEGGARSSFFVIPFNGDPGQSQTGPAPRSRAAGYGAADIADDIEALRSQGCEIGLHGIDAWRDVAKGGAELGEIRRFSGADELGVRMHWLYFDEHSPLRLEEAGADYDSTIGYNDAVGYRAGTTQVFKPLPVTRLLELPLHIMDTALFYPSRMALSREEARTRVSDIISNAARHGGVVTVNWHDRSLAPERCWGEFYVDVIQELRDRGAWFATAAETIAWFRRRRAAGFDEAGRLVEGDNDRRATNPTAPGLQLLAHASQGEMQTNAFRERVTA